MIARTWTCPSCGIVVSKGASCPKCGAADSSTPMPTTLPPNTVTITDIKIPFTSLVWFMAKVTLAAIPALILATSIIYMVIIVYSAAMLRQ